MLPLIAFLNADKRWCYADYADFSLYIFSLIIFYYNNKRK